MQFTELYEIERGRQDTWFDPILTSDTQLFVDPFLIYENEIGLFKDSHAEVIAVFNSAFKLVAASGGNPESQRYRKAHALMRFPEVAELCLGYTASGTSGAGSSHTIATAITASMWAAVEAGVKEISHFEEIALFNEGIGADRISDAVCGILRDRLMRYTAAVAERHEIETQEVRYLRSRYDVANERWISGTASLPMNPYNEKPILLVPQRYLRDLPSVNADAFWDFCYSNENETLRDEFGYDVSRSVAKRDIVKLARKYPQFVREYTAHLEEVGSSPYDFARDPQGMVEWYRAAKQFVDERPFTFLADSRALFRKSVAALIAEFKHFVEQNRGHELLWNDDGTQRNERAAQNLFRGITIHHCRANDIDLSREADVGRGPVDFRATKGYALRVLIEVKKANNTKFWHGLETQLPVYMRADGISDGFFVVIIFTDEDNRRVSDVRSIAKRVAKRLNYEIEVVVVDARKPPSASRA